MSQTDDQFIYNILMNNRSSALLSVAVDLKLFDFFKDKNVNAHEISNHFKFSLRGADAVLVGLTSLNLLDHVEISDSNDWFNHSYKLNQLSEQYLTINSPLYLGILYDLKNRTFDINGLQVLFNS